MPSYDPSLFNVNPYYDDFNEDKKFLRTLFRPGYAVQSRELTQLQTVLQNQIERLGNHLFKDGERVIGGDITTQTLNFVRVLPAATNNPNVTLSSTILTGNNLIQRNQDGTVRAKAKVVDYISKETETDPYGVAIISYLSGNTFTSGATLETDYLGRYLEVTTSSQNTEGKCRIACVVEGIYYVDGFFIKTPDSFLTLYTTTDGVRNFSSPSGIFGFEVNREIITERDDYTIKDPANGAYNYNAPGAHRYKIDLVPRFVDENYTEDIIPLVTYSNGEISKKLEDSQYKELVKILAQRTYDESGNYITKPFDIAFRDGVGNTLYADVFAGKAYVFGYEYETKFKETVEIPKARTVSQYNDIAVADSFSNYIKGTYTPRAGDNFEKLFSTINQSFGEKSKTYLVYGATAPIGLTQGLPYAIFQAQLQWIEPDNINEYSTILSGPTASSGVKFKAYIGDLRYTSGIFPDPVYIFGNLGATLNLYYFDPVTSLSYKLLNNIDLYRNSPEGTESNSRLPDFSNALKQQLVYQINGSLPNTMVSKVDHVEYAAYRSVAFTVSDDTPLPTVSLGLGSNYNWCFGSNFSVPINDYTISEEDGYYVVYNQGNALRQGTYIRIVNPNRTVPAGQTAAYANIVADGDQIRFTSRLPNGGYYLVGKVKNSANIPANPQNLASAVRTKTLTTRTESISSASTTLGFFKRIITRSGPSLQDPIIEIFFQLDKADGYKINSVTSNGQDISNRFVFDSGQRDSIYYPTRLYVKPEYFNLYWDRTPVTFEFSVNYDYFEHGGYGPFIKDSYIGISYDAIPVFTSPFTGKSINLANAIDFRHIAEIDGFYQPGTSGGTLGSGPAPLISYTNGIMPIAGSIYTDHEAYLPRIDRIVISKNISADDDLKTLKRIAGTPSDVPQAPEDLADSMTIYLLKVPAYTFNVTDIGLENISNNRLTMKEIGDISKRIDDLEQHTVLSDLELSVAQKDINTSAGDDAIKRAILVDPFNGHSNSDVIDTDHRCSIDVERGELRASFKTNSYLFEYTGANVGITLTQDNILCGSYSKNPIPLIEQKSSSKVIKINPFSLPNWVGCLRITPHADNWYDTSTRPVVLLNNTSANDNWLITNMNGLEGHGSQWNDWESIWSGIPVEVDSFEEKTGINFFAKTREKDPSSTEMVKRWKTKDGIQRISLDSAKKRSQYTTNFRKNNFYAPVDTDTIINKSVVPYARAKQITFSAFNMKPSTTVYAFMDNLNVTQFCNIGGVTGQLVTGITTGSLENVSLSLPTGSVSIGEKILRIIDDPNNVVSNATTIAEGTYYVTGYKAENQYGIESIRNPEIRKQTPGSNKVISNPLYKSKSINTIKYNKWVEPVIQTFEISEDSYPSGTFLESVDLYFSSKDDELPVLVEICPTVSGVPHSTVIVPFSTVVKLPAAVNISQSEPVATNFKFSTPVFLAPGQYGLIIRTNSSKYSVFAANIGEVDIITEQRISKTFDGGVLFSANNSAEPVGDNSTDLKFAINRCLFTTLGGANDITLNHIYENRDDVVSVVSANPFLFLPDGVSVQTKLKLENTEYHVTPGRNLYLNDSFTIDSSASVEMILGIQNIDETNLTFMIDMDRTNAIVVENVINSSENSTVRESLPVFGEPSSGIQDNTARYISKQVRIPGGKTAKELIVILDAYIPTGSFVRVYGRGINSEQIETQVGRVPYVRMQIQPESEFYEDGVFTNSINSDDFREAIYRVSPAGTEKFDTFGVKICLYANNPAVAPVVKNLRVVAIE